MKQETKSGTMKRSRSTSFHQFLDFTEAQSQKLPFPVGCPVVAYAKNGGVYHGLVTSVRMKFSTMEVFYCVQPQMNSIPPLFIAEDYLHYAPSCFVWATLVDSVKAASVAFVKRFTPGGQFFYGVVVHDDDDALQEVESKDLIYRGCFESKGGHYGVKAPKDEIPKIVMMKEQSEFMVKVANDKDFQLGVKYSLVKKDHDLVPATVKQGTNPNIVSTLPPTLCSQQSEESDTLSQRINAIFRKPWKQDPNLSEPKEIKTFVSGAVPYHKAGEGLTECSLFAEKSIDQLSSTVASSASGSFLTQEDDGEGSEFSLHFYPSDSKPRAAVCTNVTKTNTLTKCDVVTPNRAPELLEAVVPTKKNKRPVESDTEATSKMKETNEKMIVGSRPLKKRLKRNNHKPFSSRSLENVVGAGEKPSNNVQKSAHAKNVSNEKIRSKSQDQSSTRSDLPLPNKMSKSGRILIPNTKKCIPSTQLKVSTSLPMKMAEASTTSTQKTVRKPRIKISLKRVRSEMLTSASCSTENATTSTEPKRPSVQTSVAVPRKKQLITTEPPPSLAQTKDRKVPIASPETRGFRSLLNGWGLSLTTAPSSGNKEEEATVNDGIPKKRTICVPAQAKKSCANGVSEAYLVKPVSTSSSTDNGPESNGAAKIPRKPNGSRTLVSNVVDSITLSSLITGPNNSRDALCKHKDTNLLRTKNGLLGIQIERVGVKSINYSAEFTVPSWACCSRVAGKKTISLYYVVPWTIRSSFPPAANTETVSSPRRRVLPG